MFEVVDARPLAAGGVVYSLAPWREDLAIRSLELYDESSERGREGEQAWKDEPATVSFTPDKPGTYAFKCARFCGMGHGKMKGEIVVTP